MANNNFINPNEVAAMALDVLENEATFIKGMSREYSEEFANGANIGYTVNVKTPPKWDVGEGPTIEPQAMTQGFVPISIEKQFHVPAAITSADLTLTRSDFYDVLKESAVPQLANKLDQYAINKCWGAVSNYLTPDGGLGVIDGRTITPANAVSLFGLARQYMTEVAVPASGRVGVWAPKAIPGLTTGYSNLFQAADGETRFKQGKLGTVSGIDNAEDVNMPTLVNGTLNTTAATGASAQGSTNAVQADRTTPYSMTIAAPGATIKVGQVITIAGLYEVNPLARESLGRLKTFRVVGNGTAGTDIGASDTTMQILPYPVFSGPFKNVHSATGAIPGSSVITSVSGVNSSSYSQSMIFHPSAFQLVTAKLSRPTSGECGFANNPKTGLSIRYWRQSDIRSDQHISRFDVLVGAKATYPELAMIVSG